MRKRSRFAGYPRVTPPSPVTRRRDVGQGNADQRAASRKQHVMSLLTRLLLGIAGATGFLGGFVASFLFILAGARSPLVWSMPFVASAGTLAVGRAFLPAGKRVSLVWLALGTWAGGLIGYGAWAGLPTDSPGRFRFREDDRVQMGFIGAGAVLGLLVITRSNRVRPTQPEKPAASLESKAV
jgi:hypothetical protein